MLYLVYFSPTGTTRKIVASVGKGLFEEFLCRTKTIDLTPLAARMRAHTFHADDIVVFGAPVYGGRIPSLLLPVLREWSGNGAKALAVCVYGNRDYDDALLETRDLLEERGFNVCGAAAFIGQHSYTAKVGTKRPDAEDLLAAQTFAHAAAKKLRAGARQQKPIRGTKPYKEYSAFLLSPKAAPAVDAALCTHCAACITACPVCNLAADLSDCGRCIACAACVQACPTGARAFTDEGVRSAATRLEQNYTARRSPEFFL